MKIRRKTIVKLSGAISALIVSFGIVFGLAAFGNTGNVDFDHPKDTISYFDATPQKTKLNLTKGNPYTTGFNVDFPDQNNEQNKFNYAALVIDGATHQVLDKSFNQSGYQGLVDWIWTDDWYEHPKTVENISEPDTSWPANEGSANGVKPTSDDANDFWKTYTSLIGGGYKTLVLPGFMHQNGLSNFSKKGDNYKNAGYILLDANTPEDPNIASIIFRADEAAFMTGIATCQYLNDNFDDYKDNGGLKVGTFGGLPIPSVTIYMGGFEYGIKVWNDNIEDIAKANNWSDPEEHKVNIIDLGVRDSWFSNSFSIGDGKPLAKSLLQRGADAIMPVAGPQTVDTVKQIKSSKSKCIVIGVDTAQENDPTTNDKSFFTDASGNNDIVKFSAMKNIADITSKILSLSYAGETCDKTENPTIGSYGYLTVGDYSNDGIMPSENSWDYLLEFIENITGKTPDEDENHYDFILNQLEKFQVIDSETSTNYFAEISKPENMQLRI